MIDIAFYIVLFLVLLALSAFFSGSETAYFSLSAGTLESFSHSQDTAEQRVAQLMKTPRQLLITIVLGNTLANVTTASVAAILTTRICQTLGVDQRIGVMVDVLVVTLVLLITSEILPKVIAVRSPRRFSCRASRLLSFFFYLLFPISLFFARFTNFMQQKIGFAEDKTLLSEEELKTLVEVGEEHGTLQKEEKEMIHSIFEFGETTVKEIMVPRPDMVCVEAGSTLNDLMKLFKSKMHSRIPVYKERIDNIIGILYVKDLLPYLTRRSKERIQLEKLVRPAYFVPEQKKIDELLREFQSQRTHMAIVVDEYGGVAGLVTLEDIIEEIVGEIQDEYDREAPLFTRLDENTYRVDGRMSLEEVNEELHLNLPTEEGVETISGFILSLLGSLPKENDTVEYNGYRFVVERVARNRILKVRIEKIKPDVRVPDEVAG
ncbi:MAG: HlyC/CorC family transporter [Calditrichaeota bacterium]|nr:MAG: HlyC/CorC family transporter [Calditrichota bacterium]